MSHTHLYALPRLREMCPECGWTTSGLPTEVADKARMFDWLLAQDSRVLAQMFNRYTTPGFRLNAIRTAMKETR